MMGGRRCRPVCDWQRLTVSSTWGSLPVFVGKLRPSGVRPGEWQVEQWCFSPKRSDDWREGWAVWMFWGSVWNEALTFWEVAPKTQLLGSVWNRVAFFSQHMSAYIIYVYESARVCILWRKTDQVDRCVVSRIHKLFQIFHFCWCFWL